MSTAHRYFYHGQDQNGKFVIQDEFRKDPRGHVEEHALEPFQRVHDATGEGGWLIHDFLRMNQAPATTEYPQGIDIGHYQVAKEVKDIPGAWDAFKWLSKKLEPLGVLQVKYGSNLGIYANDITKAWAPQLPDATGVRLVYDEQFGHYVKDLGFAGVAFDSLSADARHLGAPRAQWGPLTRHWDEWHAYLEPQNVMLWGEQYATLYKPPTPTNPNVWTPTGQPDPARKHRSCVILPDYLHKQMSVDAKQFLPDFNFLRHNDQPNFLFLEMCSHVGRGKPFPVVHISDLLRRVGGLATATWLWNWQDKDGKPCRREDDPAQAQHELDVAKFNARAA